MMNEKNVLLTTLLENREYLNVRKELLEMNEVDVANFIEEAPAEEAAVVFRMLPKDLAADVFTEFNTDMKHHLVVTMTDQELYSIINDLAVDDAVDMLEEMPATGPSPPPAAMNSPATTTPLPMPRHARTLRSAYSDSGNPIEVTDRGIVVRLRRILYLRHIPCRFVLSNLQGQKAKLIRLYASRGFSPKASIRH